MLADLTKAETDAIKCSHTCYTIQEKQRKLDCMHNCLVKKWALQKNPVSKPAATTPKHSALDTVPNFGGKQAAIQVASGPADLGEDAASER